MHLQLVHVRIVLPVVANRKWQIAMAISDEQQAISDEQQAISDEQQAISDEQQAISAYGTWHFKDSRLLAKTVER